MKTVKFSCSALLIIGVVLLSGTSTFADDFDKNFCIWNDKQFSAGAQFCMWKNVVGNCIDGKWDTSTNANCADNPSLSPPTSPDRSNKSAD